MVLLAFSSSSVVPGLEYRHFLGQKSSTLLDRLPALVLFSSPALSPTLFAIFRVLSFAHLLLPVCALPAFLCNLLIPHCNEGVHADGFRTLHAANAIFAPDPAVSFAGLY